MYLHFENVLRHKFDTFGFLVAVQKMFPCTIRTFECPFSFFVD